MGCSACGRKYQPNVARLHINNLQPQAAPVIPKSVYGVIKAPLQPLPPLPADAGQAQNAQADAKHEIDPSKRKE